MEGSLEYHVPAVLRLKGDLNIDALEYALRTIVNRHEILRTVILEKDGQPYQFIKDKDGWHLTLVDGARYKQNDKKLKEYTEELINIPFDLSKDDMMRGHLIKLGEQDSVLVLTVHHIASDGWSRSILVRELVQLYKAFAADLQPDLKPLSLQFADYSIWQRNYLNEKNLAEKLSYWKAKLADVAPLQLPTDYVRPSIQSTRGAIEVLYVDKALAGQLHELSQQQGTSLFMTLLATFNVLLHRYTGQSDICVGGGIAGRSQHEVEQLIGFFVNMLSFRSDVQSDLSFLELLKQIRETTLEAYAHQEMPFEKVVDTIVTERDLSRNPLFQVTFILQNTPDVPELRLGEVEFVIEASEHNTSKFDLTFSITEKDSELEVLVEYCTDLFRKETISRMLGHFRQLLFSVAKEPKQKVGRLEMMSNDEKNQLLVEFNNTLLPYPTDKSIIDCFQEQVSKTPKSTAVVFDQLELTYQELNERSNQLANYLVKQGVKEETLVAICIERSVEMMVGILAILKAGGAYVPIDPTYPEERIHFIVKDSAAQFVVTNAQQVQKLQGYQGVGIVKIDEQFSEISKGSKENLAINIHPQNLAYVIYTSGSTGKPKGAMIEHRSVVNLITTQTKTFNIDSTERILQFSNYSFDASVEQIFLALFNGASLYLFTEGLQLETLLFENFIKEKKITHLHTTPSFLTSLDPYNLTGLKRVIAGGDLCKKELADKWRNTASFYNEYGPTETTVTAIEYMANLDKDEKVSNLPIGKPIGNVSTYIVDQHNNICPVGIPGELYIGGVQVGRGYLNRANLTAEKFVLNPFVANSKERLYRTGDIAKWQSDGNIQFLGRIDDQVKIRGYRIEIGEIENVLEETDLVEEAVVIAKPEDESNLKLISYYVPSLDVIKAKERELYEKQVLTWNALYNTEYLAPKLDDSVDPEFDIIGWNDSFTGLPIPEKQMQYWLKDIVDVIFSEKPNNVLEIGCGTGLIYYQLAGKVNKYIGTDFSRSSVAQIQNWINKGLRDYGETELYVCAAHEVKIKEEEQIDTVIINSVIQYFPGQDYMTNVVKNSIKALKGKGRIIIGDVRDYRLLELFQSRLSIEKFQHSVSLKEFTWAVKQDVSKEEELCYSPDYFYHLQTIFPEITHINIQWKTGSYSNELTLYRFNVVIYVGEPVKLDNPDWKDWSGESTIAKATEEFNSRIPVVALSDVPNPRLWREKILSKAIAEKQVNVVGDLLDMVQTEDKESSAIANLIEHAESRGYSYKLLLDEELFKVNMIFELKRSNKLVLQPYKKVDSSKHNTSFTNIPLFADIASILQKDIRSILQKSLPEYMIPADFVAVSHLPLTSNGKVDRAFLAKREERGVVNKQNYQPPTSAVEVALAEIWKELLGIDRIGIYDNFFELGGHSLLAIRVIAAIREKWEVELLVKDIFEYSTISDLSKYIEIQLNIYTLEDDSAEFEIVTL
ncbi:non-ribosomal peptide synthetase, partial [Segetibacter aerophilus]|uniref:Carrier domain-containing protein n=1 Tax=Segetibacter aerophilus TaxID=670293 RepID=A0A512BK12_9BACT